MPRRVTPTISEAVEKYQTMRRLNVSRMTLANDQSCLRAFARAMGERRQVHTLTAEDVEGYMISERERQKASSYNKVRQRVAGFMEFCRHRGWIDHNPMAFVGRVKEMRQERFRLSVADLYALPDYGANSRDRILLAIAANTALRANEITRLKVRDVDLDAGWLHVVITKSGVEDTLPISAELDTELRRWFAAYEADTGKPLAPDWYLVPRRESAKGNVHPDGTWVGGVLMQTVGAYLPEAKVSTPAQIVTKALRAQGHTHLGPGEGVHTIRRSVARAFFDSLVAAGTDAALRQTSALLHHSSIEVTERYIGLTAERLGRDRALRGKPFLSAMVEKKDSGPLRIVK